MWLGSGRLHPLRGVHAAPEPPSPTPPTHTPYTPPQPPLLNRPGMGAKLVTYYRKKGPADLGHQALEAGECGYVCFSVCVHACTQHARTCAHCTYAPPPPSSSLPCARLQLPRSTGSGAWATWCRWGTTTSHRFWVSAAPLVLACQHLPPLLHTRTHTHAHPPNPSHFCAQASCPPAPARCPWRLVSSAPPRTPTPPRPLTFCSSARRLVGWLVGWWWVAPACSREQLGARAR